MILSVLIVSSEQYISCRDEHQPECLPVDIIEFRGTLRSAESREGQRGVVSGRAEGDAGGNGKTDDDWWSDCSWGGERGGG